MLESEYVPEVCTNGTLYRQLIWSTGLGDEVLLVFVFVSIFSCGMLGVPGNVMVIVTVCWKRVLRYKPHYQLIVAMAINDLVVCAFTWPMVCFTMLETPSTQWYVVYPKLAQVLGFVNVVGIFISTGSHAGIALHRCIAICASNWYDKNWTWRKTGAIIFATYALPIVTYIVHHHTGLNHFTLLPPFCFPVEMATQWYSSVILHGILFYFPGLIVLVCFVLMLRRLSKPFTNLVDISVSKNQSQTTTAAEHRKKQRRQVQLICWIVSVDWSLYIPGNVMYLTFGLLGLFHDVSNTLIWYCFFIALYFGYFASVTSPIVYLVTDKNFRQTLAHCLNSLLVGVNGNDDLKHKASNIPLTNNNNNTRTNQNPTTTTSSRSPNIFHKYTTSSHPLHVPRQYDHQLMNTNL